MSAALAVLSIAVVGEGNSRPRLPVALLQRAATPDEPRVCGRTIAEWTPDLASPVMQARRRACRAFTKFRPAGSAAASALTAALGDKEATVRMEAAEARPAGTARDALEELRKIREARSR